MDKNDILQLVSEASEVSTCRCAVKHDVCGKKGAVLNPLFVQVFAKHPDLILHVYCEECKSFYSSRDFVWIDNAGAVIGLTTDAKFVSKANYNGRDWRTRSRSMKMDEHVKKLDGHDYSPRVLERLNIYKEWIYFAWTPDWEGPARYEYAEALDDLIDYLDKCDGVA